VDGLIARGMITREDHPADRRRLKLTVTRCGQEILETSRRGTLACLAERLCSINASDRETIVKAMKALQPIFMSDAHTRKVMK
jgi:DNA-binding MarR family transcriptional regulator